MYVCMYTVVFFFSFLNAIVILWILQCMQPLSSLRCDPIWMWLKQM
jgi:hypothetical protein